MCEIQNAVYYFLPDKFHCGIFSMVCDQFHDWVDIGIAIWADNPVTQSK